MEITVLTENTVSRRACSRSMAFRYWWKREENASCLTRGRAAFIYIMQNSWVSAWRGLMPSY